MLSHVIHSIIKIGCRILYLNRLLHKLEMTKNQRVPPNLVRLSSLFNQLFSIFPDMLIDEFVMELFVANNKKAGC